MTERLRNIDWVNLIIQLAAVLVVILIPAYVGFTNLKSNQAVVIAQLNDALVRQKSIEGTVNRIQNKQTDINARLESFISRLEKVEKSKDEFYEFKERINTNFHNIIRIQTTIDRMQTDKIMKPPQYQ